MAALSEVKALDRLMFAKAERGIFFGLTDGANIAVDITKSNYFSVTLGGNRTLSSPTGDPVTADGQAARILFRIRQDGTGTRTLAYGADFRFPGGVAPVLTTAINKTDYLAFIYNEVDAKWDFVGSSFNL